ncbi:MAG TPA: hypothetical protein VHE79_14110 [Spirochaetia bacterium]
MSPELRAHRLLFLVLLLCALPIRAVAQSDVEIRRPGREVSLPKSEVKDTFFAYVLGIIKTSAELDVDNGEMRDILTEFTSKLDLPFDLIERVRQHTDETTGKRVIGLDFLRDVDIPIPFALLFYHPGSLVSTRQLLFSVTRSTALDVSSPGVFTPVFDLALVRGAVLVDLDEWLEVLFSAYLEDTWIHHIVFFRWKGDWIGLLEGAGRRTGRELRAYFDFTKNTIVFPVPAELDTMGKNFVPVAMDGETVRAQGGVARP